MFPWCSRFRAGAGRPALTLTLALAAATPAAAQVVTRAPGGDARAGGGAQPPVLDAATRGAILDTVSAWLGRAYVDADTARLIGARLAARRTAGTYDAMTHPEAFAEAVSGDMRAINGDLHLRLRYDPAFAASVPPLGARGAAFGGPPPDDAVPMPPPRTPGKATPVPELPAEVTSSPRYRQAIRENFGLGRAEILPGNIGYLEITGFWGAPGAEAAIDDVLRFLERTDALIIDLRRNPGGSSVMSHLIMSHFVDSVPVPTLRVTNRSAGTTWTQTTFRTVPGPRRPEVPLYVLTSPTTGSAAEEFAFVLQHLKRATIVGERTAGAGHMVGEFNAGHGFVVGISYTRVQDPAGRREWERVGVQPDVQAPARRARDVAAEAALTRLGDGKNVDPARKAEYERIRAVVRARAEAPPIDAARAAAIAGSYEGGRTLTWSEGQLWYRTRVSLDEALIPLADGGFLHPGGPRLRVEGTGADAVLVIERGDGRSTRHPREVASSSAS